MLTLSVRNTPLYRIFLRFLTHRLSHVLALALILALTLLPSAGSYAAPPDKYKNMEVPANEVSDQSTFLRAALKAVEEQWRDLAKTMFESEGRCITKDSSPLTEAQTFDAVQSSVDSYIQKNVSKSAAIGKKPKLFKEDKVTKGKIFYIIDKLYNQENYINASNGKLPYVEQYKFLVTVFYDFTLVALDDPEAHATVENNITHAISGKTPTSKTVISVTRNHSTTQPAITKLESSKTVSATVASSTSNTAQYSFSQEIGSQTKLSAPFSIGVEQTFSFSFTAQNMVSNTIQETKTDSTTDTTSSGVSSTAEPQTAVLEIQESFNGRSEVSYSYPVAVQYKVMLIRVNVERDRIPGAELVDSRVYNVKVNKYEFGSDENNAVDCLIARYAARVQSGGDSAHSGEGSQTIWDFDKRLNASKHVRDPRSDVSVISGWLDNARPYNHSGGTLSVFTEGVERSVIKKALHPLTKVVATKPFDEDYPMRFGDKLYIDKIPLEGRNEYSVPYVEFVADSGEWKLLDANGNDISASGNGVAALKTEPQTKRTYIEAGNTAGTVYLKYFIAEGRYNFYNNGPEDLEKYAKNSDLTSTAVVKLDVAQGKPSARPTKWGPFAAVALCGMVLIIVVLLRRNKKDAST